MIFQVGQKVFWSDPAGETSDVYTISKIIDDDTVLVTNEHSEAEVYISELMHLDEVYVCKECKSFDIEELMWCKLNTRKSVITDVAANEQYFCNDCEHVYDSMPKPYLELLKNSKNKKSK